MKKNILTFWFLTFSFISIAQLLKVDSNDIYNDKSLPRIDITIASENLEYILDPANSNSNEEFTATFQFKSNILDVTEENIGFRLRGNTSRNAAKKSFKVSINTFEKGRDLKGLEKINLNGEHNDPTIMRTKLSWDLMNSLNLPSSRANHVELYINEDYYGLYLNVEHIDEEFIELRFGNKEGNLYKCLYPADLKHKGTDPNEYKEEFSGRRAYELKRNEEEDDYSGLANFISVLNQTSRANFVEEIEKVFDVPSYLKALAVETLIAHWDNHSINQNNFYLYDNPADGKFYYIPFDLDNTLGVDFFDVDWAEWNIYTWYNDNRPLPKKILEVQKYREEYTRVIDQLLKNEFLSSNIDQRIDQHKALIQDASERDEYRTLDYGFTIEDFNTSFTNRLDNFHVRYGLKEFISRRQETAIAQLDEVVLLSNFKTSREIKIYPNPAKEIFNISVVEQSGDFQINIFTLDGKLVLSESHSGTNITIYHNLPSGSYFIKVQDEDYHSAISQMIYILD